MFELPLFPLNTVLFPGMPLPLHIFEQRYKQMIQLCVDEERPFGVVLIRRGKSVGGPLATTYSIGCTARIIQVEPLVEERMLVMTIGQERFRIHSLKHDKPYLVGMVELAPLDDVLPKASSRMFDRLYPLVVEYLDILSDKIGEVSFNTSQIPTDLQQLVYLAAAFVQLPQEQKQPLLEMDKASTLLSDLYRIYRREIALMRTMPSEDLETFSQN